MFFDPVHANNQLNSRGSHSGPTIILSADSGGLGGGVSQLYDEKEKRIRWEARKGHDTGNHGPWKVEEQKIEKIKTKGKWLRGRCGLCNSFVNNCYHRCFCGYCGTRLEWGNQ